MKDEKPQSQQGDWGYFLILKRKENREMNTSINLFSKYVEKVHGIVINDKQVPVESVCLYLDELDEEMVPLEDLREMPEPLTILLMSYEDQRGNDWLFSVVVEEAVYKLKYAFCLKNGQLVDKSIPLDQ
jgi:hypothetical protein